jgi:hypothetical protein
MRNRATFYRWCDLHTAGGPEALGDRPSRPQRTWNRIPEAIRSRIVELVLEEPELSPREIAVRFTDRESYFVQRLRCIGSSRRMTYHQPSVHRRQSGR